MQSRDLSVFVDEDKSAYVTFASSENPHLNACSHLLWPDGSFGALDSNADLVMARLSEDYVSLSMSWNPALEICLWQRLEAQLDVVEIVHVWKQVFWEATGMFKEKGVYYLVFSLQVRDLLLIFFSHSWALTHHLLSWNPRNHGNPIQTKRCTPLR